MSETAEDWTYDTDQQDATDQTAADPNYAGTADTWAMDSNDGGTIDIGQADQPDVTSTGDDNSGNPVDDVQPVSTGDDQIFVDPPQTNASSTGDDQIFIDPAQTATPCDDPIFMDPAQTVSPSAGDDPIFVNPVQTPPSSTDQDTSVSALTTPTSPTTAAPPPAPSTGPINLPPPAPGTTVDPMQPSAQFVGDPNHVQLNYIPEQIPHAPSPVASQSHPPLDPSAQSRLNQQLSNAMSGIGDSLTTTISGVNTNRDPLSGNVTYTPNDLQGIQSPNFGDALRVQEERTKGNPFPDTTGFESR